MTVRPSVARRCKCSFTLHGRRCCTTSSTSLARGVVCSGLGAQCGRRGMRWCAGCASVPKHCSAHGVRDCGPMRVWCADRCWWRRPSVTWVHGSGLSNRRCVVQACARSSPMAPGLAWRPRGACNWQQPRRCCWWRGRASSAPRSAPPARGGACGAIRPGCRGRWRMRTAWLRGCPANQHAWLRCSATRGARSSARVLPRA